MKKSDLRAAAVNRPEIRWHRQKKSLLRGLPPPQGQPSPRKGCCRRLSSKSATAGWLRALAA